MKTENSVVYLICLKEILDRENKSSYDLELVATDFGRYYFPNYIVIPLVTTCFFLHLSPPKSASVSFTIEIEDINDNPPVFGQTAYRVNISEDSFPGMCRIQALIYYLYLFVFLAINLPSSL